MKNIEVYNTLNIDKDSSSIVATFTQEDDAVMEFKLFKDGQEIVLKDQTISLGAERKDGAVIEQEDGFLIKENNVLNITLKKNIISVVGVVKIQIYLKDTSGEMASNTFNIRVNKKLLGAENIEATNDIKTLNTLVLELKNNTNKLIDDTKAKADKLLNGLQETGDNLSSTVKAKTDKLIEDTKKDYDSLKKTIIDENISIKLQEDIKTLQNGLKTNQNLSYEGSSITANDTLEGRTESMIIKGRTLHNLEPSKNISMDISKWNTFTKGSKDMYKPNTKYTVIVIIEDNKLTEGVCTFVSDDTNTSTIFRAGTDIVLTKESKGIYTKVCTTKDNLENCIRVGFWTHTPSTTKGSLIFSMMVLEGDWTNEEIPNYFEGIKSFGEAEQEGDKYKISILSHGKNLCDFQKSKLHGSLNAYITEKNGEFSFTVGVDDKVGWFAETDNIKLEEGAYNISIEVKAELSSGYQKFWYGVYYFDINGKSLGYGGTYVNTTNSFSRNNISITAPKDVAYGKFRIYNYSNIAGTITFRKPQLEKEAMMTSYEDYIQDKKDILLSAPLRGFNGVKDIMYENNGQVEVNRNIAKTILNNSSGWKDLESDGTYTKMSIAYFKGMKYGCPVICDQLPQMQDTGGVQNQCEYIATTGDSYYSIVVCLKVPNQEEFLKRIEQHPLEVYYQLSTPVTEIVESIDIDLDTFQDITYVNIENSLQGTLDFKVPSNIGSSLQNLAKEVNNIWDVINNLLVPGILDVNKKVALATIKNNLK